MNNNYGKFLSIIRQYRCERLNSIINHPHSLKIMRDNNFFSYKIIIEKWKDDGSAFFLISFVHDNCTQYLYYKNYNPLSSFINVRIFENIKELKEELNSLYISKEDKENDMEILKALNDFNVIKTLEKF